MSHRGFSHIGVSTLDLDKIREFYEGVLGFKPVVADTITVKEGGHLRHFFSMSARSAHRLSGTERRSRCAGRLRCRHQPRDRRSRGFYHFAFEAGSAAGLAERRDELRARGVETTD